MMSMTPQWNLPMTPIAAITLTVGSAEAQYIESSTWDSNYGQYDAGPQTCAQLRFQGPGGDYQTGSGSGNLSAVCYRPDPWWRDLRERMLVVLREPGVALRHGRSRWFAVRWLLGVRRPWRPGLRILERDSRQRPLGRISSGPMRGSRPG